MDRRSRPGLHDRRSVADELDLGAHLVSVLRHPYRRRLDPRYGARLGEDLRAAGLVEVHADYVAGRDPGGSLTPRLLSLTFERLRQRMLTLGADDHDINETRALLED